MVNKIPDHILPLVSQVVNGIEEYESCVNQDTTGIIGDIYFLDLINKKTNEQVRFVIKYAKPIPEIGPLTFNNEITFYKTVWPTITQFWKEQVGKALPEFITTCYLTSKSPYGLVLKDLAEDGFVSFPMRKKYDDDLCKFLFERYGVFHGLSMAYKKRYPVEFLNMVRPFQGLFEYALGEKRLLAKLMLKYFEECMEYFNSKEHDKILKKLQEYAINGHNIVRDAVVYDIYDCFVLHGDCWSNNILFKYDKSEKPIDIRLIDFQTPIGSSPVCDLSFLLYSGAPKDLLDKLEIYLTVYHSSLSNILREFGYNPEDIYSFDRLKYDWKKYSKFGFGAAIGVLRGKYGDRNTIPELTTYKEGDIVTAVDLEKSDAAQCKELIKGLIFHVYENDFL